MTWMFPAGAGRVTDAAPPGRYPRAAVKSPGSACTRLMIMVPYSPGPGTGKLTWQPAVGKASASAFPTGGRRHAHRGSVASGLGICGFPVLGAAELAAEAVEVGGGDYPGGVVAVGDRDPLRAWLDALDLELGEVAHEASEDAWVIAVFQKFPQPRRGLGGQDDRRCGMAAPPCGETTRGAGDVPQRAVVTQQAGQARSVGRRLRRAAGSAHRLTARSAASSAAGVRVMGSVPGAA